MNCARAETHHVTIVHITKGPHLRLRRSCTSFELGKTKSSMASQCSFVVHTHNTFDMAQMTSPRVSSHPTGCGRRGAAASMLVYLLAFEVSKCSTVYRCKPQSDHTLAVASKTHTLHDMQVMTCKHRAISRFTSLTKVAKEACTKLKTPQMSPNLKAKWKLLRM
eukprot:4579838-Amphidinium_carterae.1